MVVQPLDPFRLLYNVVTHDCETQVGGRALGAKGEGEEESLTQNKRFSSLVDLFTPSKSQLSDQAALLDRLSRKASSSLSIEEVCEQIAPEVRGLIPFERLSLQYVDLEKGSVTEEYATGLDAAGQRRGDAIPLADSPVQEAVNSRSSVLVALIDVESLDELSSQLPAIKPSLEAGVRSLLTVPVVSSDQVIAALSRWSRTLTPRSTGSWAASSEPGSPAPSPTARSTAPSSGRPRRHDE